jgi:hypothetical protein
VAAANATEYYSLEADIFFKIACDFQKIPASIKFYLLPQAAKTEPIASALKGSVLSKRQYLC